jgi:hypothetical protein
MRNLHKQHQPVHGGPYNFTIYFCVQMYAAWKLRPQRTAYSTHETARVSVCMTGSTSHCELSDGCLSLLGANGLAPVSPGVAPHQGRCLRRADLIVGWLRRTQP